VHLVLLERDEPTGRRGHPTDAGDELGRLDAQAHLVAVVLAAHAGPVHPAADLDEQ